MTGVDNTFYDWWQLLLERSKLLSNGTIFFNNHDDAITSGFLPQMVSNVEFYVLIGFGDKTDLLW